MATLHYAENVHIAQTLTRIPTVYFSLGQESESVPQSVSGNINEPLDGNIEKYRYENYHYPLAALFRYIVVISCRQILS